MVLILGFSWFCLVLIGFIGISKVLEAFASKTLYSFPNEIDRMEAKRQVGNRVGCHPHDLQVDAESVLCIYIYIYID